MKLFKILVKEVIKGRVLYINLKNFLSNSKPWLKLKRILNKKKLS